MLAVASPSFGRLHAPPARPKDRRVPGTVRPGRVLDHAAHGARRLRRRPHAVRVQQEQRVHARARVAPVRARLPARGWLHDAVQRARAGRHSLLALVAAQEGVVRLCLLPDLVLPVRHHGHGHELALRQELLHGARGLARSRRHPVPVPAQVGDHRRLRAADAPGDLPEHQELLLGHGLGAARGAGDRDPLMPPEQIIAALMFAGMIAFLFLGFPVAFSLTFTGLFFGLIGVGFGYLHVNFFDILPLRIWGTMTNFTLLAVPLFVFMGVALEKSGLAEELLETMALLFGKLKGGIAISVVVVGAILAASTGIVGASVITMGLISLPTMLRRGYDKQLICGTICASGTLGQIIPPSVILVLLGDIMGVSVGDLYIGAVLPGLVLVALYIMYIAILGRLRPELAPAIPDAELREFRAEALKRVTMALIPALVLIVAVLGAIFAGVATPTEAASVGAVGGIGLTMVKRKFSWAMLRNVMEATTRITSLAFIILVGANCFGLVFRGLNGDHLIQDFLKALPLGRYGVLAVVMFVIFVLGFFIDFFEICFIHVPILTPVLVTHFGFDPMWLGVVIGVNLQTSFLTPPFGFALFYLRGVAPPEIKTTDIYRGVVPFVALQLIGLTLVIAYPEIVFALIRFFRG